MKRARRAFLWAALCAVIALSGLAPEKRASLQREALLKSRYGGWAGVLRLWTFYGWESGRSLTAWLSAAAAAFEKAHPGVYIQLTEVSADAMRAFAAGAASPPDMILFPPGLLEGPAGLLPLPGDWPMRAGLADCGLAAGARYALPVAMGAYGMAYNRAAMDGLPADWNALPEKPAPAGCGAWLDWPADGEYLHWSRAQADLLAPVPPEAVRTAPRAGEGLDLGLPAAARFAGMSVYARFVNGEIAAMPVTQREIWRLRLLSESGRGPDWAVAARASGYADQIALLAVTDCGKTEQPARQALCLDFAARLLERDTQAKLAKAGAFPAIDLTPLYAGSEGMAQLEAGLNAAALRPAPAFGTQ